MGLRDDYAVLAGGRLDRRLETVVNRETDAAITLLANQLGCNRSAAARVLLARGAAADKELMTDALAVAKESRDRDAAVTAA